MIHELIFTEQSYVNFLNAAEVILFFFAVFPSCLAKQLTFFMKRMLLRFREAIEQKQCGKMSPFELMVPHQNLQNTHTQTEC